MKVTDKWGRAGMDGHDNQRTVRLCEHGESKVNHSGTHMTGVLECQCFEDKCAA